MSASGYTQLKALVSTDPGLKLNGPGLKLNGPGLKVNGPGLKLNGPGLKLSGHGYLYLKALVSTGSAVLYSPGPGVSSG